MFKGFPILSKHMLDLLYRQRFRYMVQQIYPGSEQSQKAFLLSPFFAKDKADYYFKKLGKGNARFFSLYTKDLREEVLNLLTKKDSIFYIKVIEQKQILDKSTRNLIGIYLEKFYPSIFQKMLQSNFRITIADNYGDIFYKIKIGPGTEIPVKHSDLTKNSLV